MICETRSGPIVLTWAAALSLVTLWREALVILLTEITGKNVCFFAPLIVLGGLGSSREIADSSRMMHCGLEIVLPDGSLVRTGMGALPNPKADKNAPPHEQEPNECWQLFNYGFGPHHDGIFSQSNMGIVTKMGVWLIPNPGGSQTYMITFPRDDDLNRIVEIMRPLRVSMVIQNVPKLDNILVSAAMEVCSTFYAKPYRPNITKETRELAALIPIPRSF
jgi:hypothetical protein